jgi:hypothetical protein
MPNRHDRADDPLRWLIREKLLDGRLPRDNAATVFGAPADGSEICVACDVGVARGQLVVGGGPRKGEPSSAGAVSRGLLRGLERREASAEDLGEPRQPA